MPETITLNPGAGGAAVAVDVVDSASYELVKLVFGADGVITGHVSRALPLPVDAYQITDPKQAHGVAVAVAAGGTQEIDATQVGAGKTAKLIALIVAATVPWKAQLRAVSDGVEGAVLATMVSAIPGTAELRPPSKEFYTVAHSATAGLDAFRVEVTNLDTSQAADIYASFLWDEV